MQLESRAFDLVREGRAAQALELLLGEEYTAQKSAYAHGMVSLDVRLEETVETERRAQERRTVLHVMAASLAILVLVLGWLVVLRTLQTWRRNLMQELARREQLETAVAASTHEVTARTFDFAACLV